MDSEIARQIKRASAENISKEYKDESMKNKVPTNITNIIDQTVNEPNNSKDEMHIEPVNDTPVKIVND
jgi:hypothetical protein